MTYRVAYSASKGPSFFEFDTQRELLACLMRWAQSDCGGETFTLWQRVRKSWVPVFPWQHEVRS